MRFLRFLFGEKRNPKTIKLAECLDYEWARDSRTNQSVLVAFSGDRMAVFYDVVRWDGHVDPDLQLYFTELRPTAWDRSSIWQLLRKHVNPNSPQKGGTN